MKSLKLLLRFLTVGGLVVLLLIPLLMVRGLISEREFYQAKGYTPLEVFPTLWNPRNPALQLVKVLTAAG